ncbi:hypothetical protein CQ10_38565 [Bradyrhizobium valentinum]|nr:hypothetical protein CQ10_38565 [Bradyrhizobium valentinum]
MISFEYAWAIGDKYEVKSRTFGECCQVSIMVDINSAIHWRAWISPCTFVIPCLAEEQSELHFIITPHAVPPFKVDYPRTAFR